jgi:hypothetical protein
MRIVRYSSAEKFLAGLLDQVEAGQVGETPFKCWKDYDPTEHHEPGNGRKWCAPLVQSCIFRTTGVMFSIWVSIPADAAGTYGEKVVKDAAFLLFGE